MNLHWYAVYTKPRWEKKVAELLNKRGVENYCPLNKVVRQWSDRKKTIHEPLFTSYVFVRITDRQFSELRSVDGILNFVHWLGKPALIRDGEIEMVKLFLKEHANVRLEKTMVSMNDTVRVIDGPLMEHQGRVVSISSRTVRLCLPSLGFLMIADVDKTSVEVISRAASFELSMPKKYAAS